MEEHKSVSRNYKQCVVCRKRRIPGSNVFLSRFPLDEDRCRMWIKYVGQEDLVHCPIEKLHQLKFVCNSHFRTEDFNLKQNRLKKNAIPSVNMPLPPLADALLMDCPLHIGQYPKQDFSKASGNIIRMKTVDDSERAAASTASASQKGIFMKELTDTSASGHMLQIKTVDDRKSANVMTASTSQKEIFMKELPETPASENILEIKTVDDHESANVSAASTSQKEMFMKESCQLPGSSFDKITVKSYERKSKCTRESTHLSTREEKLLQKLKNQKLTLKKLAKSSLDLDKLEDTVLKELLKDIIRNNKKKPGGKRWTLKSKLWSLAIFKRSPKAYRHLEGSKSVPSIKTLQRLLKDIPLEPGINKNIILKCKDILSSSSKSTPLDLYCSLLFDEMALKKRLIYNEATDKVEGYEDYGDERTSKIADHALVFMVQGLRKKFKLPIAYYFVEGTTSSSKLMVIIKSVISILEEVGLKVVNTVCDQGPTNMGALNLLKKFGGQSQDDNFFIFDGKKVFIIFDVPHLFKSIRNNFYNAGEIVYDDKVGKWCHLILAEEENQNLLNFPKITKNVVQPTFKLKMRVKYAVHALSNTMGAVLQMLSWKYQSAEINETADVIKELDKLFDICNGPSSPQDLKKGIRENISNKTNHVEKWKYYMAKMDKIKFLKSDSHLQLNHVRCIKGFKITLRSLGDIWAFLQNEGFQYLNLRQLNQDSLENLFGMIRQHSVTNKNPTCSHFTAALKASIISGSTAKHNRGSNCEADNNRFLFNIEKKENASDQPTKLVQPPSEPIAHSSSMYESHASASSGEVDTSIPVLYIPEYEDIQFVDLCRFENQPVVYVSGYLASKLNKKDCDECQKSLINDNPDSNIYNYISLREWWEDKKSLTYPSIGLCHFVEQGKTCFENIKAMLHSNDISVRCVLEFSVHCNMSWFSCGVHKDIIIQELFKRLSLLFIRKQCKITNEKFSSNENTAKDNYKKAQTLSKA